jgi:hypothetical protein
LFRRQSVQLRLCAARRRMRARTRNGGPGSYLFKEQRIPLFDRGVDVVAH